MTTKKSASAPDSLATPVKSAKSAAKKVALKKTALAASPPADVSSAKPLAKPAAKKDVQKLQRAVVDGLESVKAHEIVVFDTEHLSPLFERVIIASGTSNRQTKALAASVVDAVRDAGFAKPRVEGEGNGEWIIVDCGQAVVHVMQPTFRTYYNLEELWGDKPVRLKLGAAKPSAAESRAPASAALPRESSSLRRSSAAKKGVEEAFPSKAKLKQAAERKAAGSSKTAAKKGATGAVSKRASGSSDLEKTAKPRVKTLVVNAPAKPAARKTAARTGAAAAPKRKPAPARKP